MNSDDANIEAKKIKTRMVGAFAGLLTSHMAAAIKETDLDWSDVVYSAALAIHAIGQIAKTICAESDAPGVMKDPVLIEQRITDIINRARNTNVSSIKVDSEAEAEAWIAAQEQGYH